MTTDRIEFNPYTSVVILGSEWPRIFWTAVADAPPARADSLSCVGCRET